jgi:hypothetical protein
VSWSDFPIPTIAGQRLPDAQASLRALAPGQAGGALTVWHQAYLQEIERAVQDKPQLIHYRILLGPPHSQVFKDHLLRLLALRPARANGSSGQTLHISILNDLTRYPERFFVASEKSAVIILPSVNSPMNFDTATIVCEPQYVHRLLQHGKALYGKHRLESVEDIDRLEVIE